MNDIYYTGVGSRSAPPDILDVITYISRELSNRNYILRSGGANGCDKAFEAGARYKEIYLPWRRFNQNPSLFYHVSEKALSIASMHHPNWDRLSDSVKLLMGRNVYQILGYNLDTPSSFLICWTQDGCESDSTRTYRTGGTGLAISISDTYGVPIFNLRSRNRMQMLYEYLSISPYRN